MIESVNAEIIAIGTEILLGEITDTNSVYIAQTLRGIGINLYYMTSVGDNEERIAEAIRIALARAQVVITSGGLGPTIDDMTRQAVAAATQRQLVFHQELLDKIAERFAAFKSTMTENNKRQAYLPNDAILIENAVGTAPAFIVQHGGGVVISLPGVPREMKYLMTETVIPYLRTHFTKGNEIIKARILRTAGIGESMLDSQIGPELLEASNPTVGLAAHTGQVDIRITAKAESESAADLMIAQVEAQLHRKIGRYVFGVNQDRIEDVLVNFLLEHKLTIAICELGIGNPISETIHAIDSTHQVLANNHIFVYSSVSQLKESLSITNDLSMQELAERVVTAICFLGNSSSGIAVISDPDMDEFHADHEGGTVVAVCFDGKIRSRIFGFGGQSDIAVSWVRSWTMSILWQMLQEKFVAI